MIFDEVNEIISNRALASKQLQQITSYVRRKYPDKMSDLAQALSCRPYDSAAICRIFSHDDHLCQAINVFVEASAKGNSALYENLLTNPNKLAQLGLALAEKHAPGKISKQAAQQISDWSEFVASSLSTMPSDLSKSSLIPWLVSSVRFIPSSIVGFLPKVLGAKDAVLTAPDQADKFAQRHLISLEDK